MGKTWYRANREKAKAYTRAWRKKNPEKAAAYWKESRRKNPEKKRLYSRYWRAKNREKDRENSRRARGKNPEKAKAAVREWAKLHPEKIREYSRIRRARRKGAKGQFTKEQWLLLKACYGSVCLCCGLGEVALASLKRQLVPDHVVPLCKGGANAVSNIQPLCHGRMLGSSGGCNEKKGVNTTDYRRLNAPTQS